MVAVKLVNWRSRLETSTKKKKRFSWHLNVFMCFEGESLGILIKHSSAAPLYLRLFLLFRFFVFWRELHRYDHLFLNRVCVSFFLRCRLFVFNKQTGNTRHSFHRMRVLRSWGAPVLLTHCNVHVSRGMHCSNFCSTAANMQRWRGGKAPGFYSADPG